MHLDDRGERLMPYTLMKGLAWILLAVLLGIVIGWLLRSVAARRQIERARRERSESEEHAELERLQARVANLEPVVNERDRLRAELDRVQSEASQLPEGGPAGEPSAVARAPAPEAVPQLDGDTSAITPDDLTVIKGIGPNTAELCHGIGIQTWSDLAGTEVSLLRTMLNDAGPRFKTLDPASWPEQARLLAAGQWSEFEALAAGLDSGRPTA